MFYVEKRRKSRRKEFAIMHIGPTLVVFVAFIILTLWSWVDSNRAIEQRRGQIMTQNITDSKSFLQDRATAYEDILRAGSGLFNASEAVSKDEWRQFAQTLDITNRYPGTSGVGFIQSVNDDQRSSYIAAMSVNNPGFSIKPEGQRQTYTPITYFEPLTDEAHNALGYDMYSDPLRQHTLDTARDTGQAALTPPIRFLKDSKGVQQEGFMLYYPIYTHGNSLPSTKEERTARIAGYIYIPFRSQALFSRVIEDNNPHFGFTISSNEGDTKTKFYESAYFGSVANQPNSHTQAETFNISGEQWTIDAWVDNKILSERERNRPSEVLWGGIAFSFLMAGFIYMLLANRTRNVAEKEASELQSAKDELLALASHQLRTPATGVKQYIGMLQEGYAGELNDKQKTYLEKAQQSNERQLGTINEMLMVARADAGHLEIKKSNFDLNKLVEDIIAEQLFDINARSQTIKSYMPKDHINLNADEHYVRMAIENVISNATKYTPEGGEVTVTLLRKKAKIQIAIRDTGVGVAKTDTPLLFQKFSRIPNELTSRVGGTGIGLYLAKKIVVAHDGEIAFDSTPNKGSVCTITLPAYGGRASS